MNMNLVNGSTVHYYDLFKAFSKIRIGSQVLLINKERQQMLNSDDNNRKLILNDKYMAKNRHKDKH